MPGVAGVIRGVAGALTSLWVVLLACGLAGDDDSAVRPFRTTAQGCCTLMTTGLQAVGVGEGQRPEPRSLEVEGGEALPLAARPAGRTAGRGGVAATAAALDAAWAAAPAPGRSGGDGEGTKGGAAVAADTGDPSAGAATSSWQSQADAIVPASASVDTGEATGVAHRGVATGEATVRPELSPAGM